MVWSGVLVALTVVVVVIRIVPTAIVSVTAVVCAVEASIYLSIYLIDVACKGVEGARRLFGVVVTGMKLDSGM